MDGIRGAGGILLLGMAAAQDLKLRKVRDWIWSAMGGTGAVLLEADLLGTGWDPLLQAALVAPFVLFLDALWDRDDEAHPMGAVLSSVVLYLCAAGLLLVPGVLLHGTSSWDRYVIYLVMGLAVALGFFLYALGVFRGGADAKAFMALALLFPSPPHLGPLPLVRPPPGAEALETLFPFTLVALLDASFLVLALPLAFLIYNLARGDLTLPQALVGYKAPLSDPPAFVWWMEGVEGGRRTLSLMPRRDQVPANQAAALARLGLEEAWATPQIPFLVPMALGSVVALVVGNLFLGLLLLF